MIPDREELKFYASMIGAVVFVWGLVKWVGFVFFKPVAVAALMAEVKAQLKPELGLLVDATAKIDALSTQQDLFTRTYNLRIERIEAKIDEFDHRMDGLERRRTRG